VRSLFRLFVFVPLSVAVALVQTPPTKGGLLVTAAPTTQGSANDALSIGSVVLRLGMPEDSALAALKNRYSLERAQYSAPTLEDYLIQEKGKPEEIIGQVRFRSGMMTLASKEWTPEDKNYSGADLAEIIYKVISRFEQEGDVACTVKTLSSAQSSGPGGLELRQTEILCGHRRLEISLSWRNGSAWVQASESIAEESEP
jgi:hypothetical protein